MSKNQANTTKFVAREFGLGGRKKGKENQQTQHPKKKTTQD